MIFENCNSLKKYLYVQEMIIQLDSNFRDYKTYPYPTEFEINVNGKPPNPERLAYRDDLRCTNITSQFIRYAYRWIGKSNGTETPLSKIPNDTFVANIIPIGPSSCLVIPNDENEQILRATEYFLGTILYYGGLSANVIAYTGFLATLDADIFTEYYGNVLFTDIMSNVRQTESITDTGYFINISNHQDRTLVLLGAPNFSDTSLLSQFSFPALSVNLFVENVTKDWYSKVKAVDKEGRSLILEDMPSFDADDFFIVWKQPGFLKDETQRPPFFLGIKRFTIKSSDPGFKKNDWVQNGTVLMRVEDVDSEGKIRTLDILHPGQKQKVGPLTLQRYQRQFVTIEVVDLGSGIIMTSTQNGDLLHKRYILAIINMKYNHVLYFTIDERRPTVIYLSIDPMHLKIIDENIAQYGVVYCYYISYETAFPNISLPMVPTQNPICANITLLSISIPNFPVCGTKIFLADFPYILCSFGNSSRSAISTRNTVISNIPAVASANFVIPIANVRNPTLTFIHLSCRQTVMVKFTPKDTLLFRLMLPDGTPLKFFPKLSQTMSDRVCEITTLPLNSFYSPNSTLVYPFIVQNAVTAVFSIDFLS
tara:strand:- start:2387 stop:4168 length:1782 start_codon:yes stop_codon:yes gene_type:complete